MSSLKTSGMRRLQFEMNLPSNMSFREKVLTSAMYLLASNAADESFRLLKAKTVVVRDKLD